LAAALAKSLVKPHADNLVERPWGGARIRAFKGLGTDAQELGRTIGESFELAADDADDEARRYPSSLSLADGSVITLSAVLALHAETLLGHAFVHRYGRRLPLLPKLLDVVELLSVQAHPPGNTEVYVILAAEPGATIRLGFNADVDAAALAKQLVEGRRQQQRLLDLCAGAVTAETLQTQLRPWLARRDASVTSIEATLRPLLPVATSWFDVCACLDALRVTYWDTLDRLNAIAVAPGQVIYNATPRRLTAVSGQAASAEVHALGNPEGRAVLALEIRRPGPTFRAWDHVRFPLREIAIDAALAALNLEATRAEDFIVTPVAVRPGVSRSVDCEYFRLEHLQPTASTSIDLPPTEPHTLHAVEGAVSVYATDGAVVGRLRRGESALVPVGVGAYRVAADEEPAAVVKVELPPYAV
jgi:mannose-6-phosphate isomerase class I